MTELLQQVFAELSKLPDEEQDAIATKLLADLSKSALTVAPENDPDDTPTKDVIEGLRQGLHEALTGQTIPISQMWDGIDAD
ncbi:MAG: hypothetical protein F6K30_05585 [Cyanothece sp. SIO2G6]|nr:hypothetical protein [Cyanothece sp. SIO2G6]